MTLESLLHPSEIKNYHSCFWQYFNQDNKKINAVFVFDIEGEGKWHVDLKNGKGGVGVDDPNIKGDVTVILKKEIFLKIFNREY